jgi:hypothetical protein
MGVWSAGDKALTEEQMTASSQYVAPGLWRYERIGDERVSHWIPRGAAAALNACLLDFLGAGRGRVTSMPQPAAGRSSSAAAGRPPSKL